MPTGSSWRGLGAAPDKEPQRRCEKTHWNC